MSLLVLENLVKKFGGLLAVDHVNFSVDRNDIVGLIGPNGAGKTTIFNLITGNAKPDDGTILFDGKRITGFKPHQIVEMGIARTFQNIRLFGTMTVLENVLAGCHCRMKSGVFSSMFHPPSQRKEERIAIENAMQELAFVGLDAEYDALAGSLSYGNQRLVEIARALAAEPKFLILDEPAGGMNDNETRELMELIQAIEARGISILLIEHDMHLVMNVCKKLIVLEYGAVIAEGEPEVVGQNKRVIEAYLGTD